jgi:hypothetical protein
MSVPTIIRIFNHYEASHRRRPADCGVPAAVVCEDLDPEPDYYPDYHPDYHHHHHQLPPCVPAAVVCDDLDPEPDYYPDYQHHHQLPPPCGDIAPPHPCCDDVAAVADECDAEDHSACCDFADECDADDHSSCCDSVAPSHCCSDDEPPECGAVVLMAGWHGAGAFDFHSGAITTDCECDGDADAEPLVEWVRITFAAGTVLSASGEYSGVVLNGVRRGYAVLLTGDVLIGQHLQPVHRSRHHH